MQTENLTALEALGVAIRSEMDAQEVYAQLAARTQNDLLKERFLNLSREEDRHRLMLEKKFHDMFPEADLQIPPTRLHDKNGNRNHINTMSIREGLQLAIDEERRSREFYLDCADKIDDLSGKRMMRFLADMEFSHQMMLSAELELIEKYPAYYEGPISWDVETRLKTDKIKRK